MNVLKPERLCEDLESSCRCRSASNDLSVRSLLLYSLCPLKTDQLHTPHDPPEIFPQRFGLPAPPVKLGRAPSTCLHAFGNSPLEEGPVSVALP